MEQRITSYYHLISDLKTLDEFKQEIIKRRQIYDDLFTDDLIAYLIIDELGRNTQQSILIKDIHPGIECSIKGTLSELSEIKSFTRKNKSSGKMRKYVITDESGSIPVILWNDDVNLLNESHMRNKSIINIINGYTKKSYHGLELNVGRWSQVIIVQNHKPSNHTKHTQEKYSIKGNIKEIQPTNIFFRDDGSEGFITKVIIDTDQGPQHLILWDDQVKTIQHYQNGDSIIISNISYRYVNGNQELHVNGSAEIKKNEN